MAKTESKNSTLIKRLLEHADDCERLSMPEGRPNLIREAAKALRAANSDGGVETVAELLDALRCLLEVQDAMGAGQSHVAQKARTAILNATTHPPAKALDGIAVTESMVSEGLAYYSEGGCMGLAESERREVVRSIIEAALAVR